MQVCVLSDDIAKLTRVREWLSDSCDVTTELLRSPKLGRARYDAVVAAIDVRQPENIIALKEMAQDLARVPKRVFLVDQQSRLSLMQAYALGATTVLAAPINRNRLCAEILGHAAQVHQAQNCQDEDVPVASVAAEYIGSMFSAVMRGTPVDVKGALSMGNEIINRVAQDGLSSWLSNVRDHHEGTFQHCLLVAGVAADFGLSLGLGAQDLTRLGLAAMLHDVGKATIPLAILDKPGD